MTTKNRRPTPDKTPSPEPTPPHEVRDAPDGDPRGPVAHVQATPQDPMVPAAVGAVEGKLRLRRAEALIAKGEAYSLAAQLESLAREFGAKRNELQRAWEKTQRKIRSLDAAIEADESTLTLLRMDARSHG